MDPTPWLNLNLAHRAQPANLNTAVFSKPTDRPGLFNNPNLSIVELALTPTKPLTLKLQYSNGTQGGEKYSVIGGNLQLALSKRIGIFGRFGYALDFPSNINPMGWSTGLALTDLFKPGAQAGLSIGQPLIFKDTLGLFTGTQTNYEAFYHYPINNNIAISPTLQVVSHRGTRSATPSSQAPSAPPSPSNHA
ncbi:MAG: carbohydrate porin [Alkalinema sp. RU_4_3]|nr:carbohydrate porin [Alkalinema sp. RU_4_3]